MYPANSNAPAKITNRGCLIYGLVIFIGVPVFLAIVAVLFLFARERSARQKLNARVATIRAQGLPVDNASMAIYHQDLTSADNMQAWLAALEELNTEAFAQSISGVPIFDGQLDDSSLPMPGDPWAEEQTTRQFLTQWDALHRQIVVLSRQQLQAGVRPVRFPIKFDSLNTAINATQEMRSAARLLMLRGQVAIFDGDSTATRESIEALLGNSLVLSGQPILISQLVSLAIDGMALDLLKKALEYDVLAPDDLKELRRIVLEKTEIGPQWHYAMHGERALVLPVFLDPSVASNALPVNTALLSPGRSHDALHYLDHIDGVLDVPLDDFDDFMASLEIEEAKLKRIASGGLLARMDSLLTSMMTPATSSAGKAFVRQATMHRLAALTIGIREFEKEQGAPPSTLAELQVVGLDPAELSPPGKKPFGYSTNDEESVIWGFDLSTEQSTPDKLPTFDPTSPNSQQWNMWIWRIPKSVSQ